MKNAGAAGFVTDGPLRDYPGIVEVGLPHPRDLGSPEYGRIKNRLYALLGVQHSV